MSIPTLTSATADAVHDDQWWEDRALAEDREGRRRGQWQWWLDKVVPKRFHNATIDGDTDPSAVTFARALLDDLAAGWSGAVVLHGYLGSGKTHLIWAVLHEAIQRGLVEPQQVLVGKEARLLGDTAAAEWAARGRLTADLLSPSHKIVFVDDVGRARQMTEKARLDLWDGLADACWEQERVLIITTNLRVGIPAATEPADRYLVSWIGQAAYDRIQDGCRAVGLPDRQMRRAHRSERQEARA